MTKNNLTLIVIIVIIALILAGNPFYIVEEGKQAIITQFGQPIGNPIISAGLHLKIPFIQKVTYFEKRILEWDGYPSEIPTKDKRYIWIDTTARWKIADALKFFKSVVNERGAHAILDGIIDAAVRDAVTAQNSVEVVRSSNRLVQLIQEKKLSDKDDFIDEGALASIKVGREKIREEIVEKAREDLGTRYGIALIDVRIKRVNYIEKVRKNVYERMIAERRRAAEQYRSEGRGIRAEVEGKTEKELKEILSQAYRESQEIKGRADAEATRISAEAYGKDPEFFSFMKTLDTYSATVDNDTTVILTTEGEYFKYLTDIFP